MTPDTTGKQTQQLPAKGTLMRLWGVSGSAASTGPQRAEFGGDTVCIELRQLARPDLPPLLIDLGSGARKASAVFEHEDIKEANILLSHLHLDHVEGICGFTPLYHTDFKANIYTGDNIEATDAQAVLEQLFHPPYYPVEPLKIAQVAWHKLPIGESKDISGFKVSGIPLHHPGGCTGYRIEGPDGVIVIAGDHEHGASNIDLGLAQAVRNCDIMIFDGAFSIERYKECRGWGHSTWHEAVRQAQEGEVTQLLVHHHMPSATDEDLLAREERMQARMPSARFARQNDLWLLENRFVRKLG